MKIQYKYKILLFLICICNYNRFKYFFFEDKQINKTSYIEFKHINKIINVTNNIIKKNDYILSKKGPRLNRKETISKLKYYKNFMGDIESYNHTHIYSSNVYWCWLQGIDNAPELYKATLNTVKHECYGHNIIIINNTNFDKYVRFPSFILEKYKNKYFSDTHFSDLLRLELLNMVELGLTLLF